MGRVREGVPNCLRYLSNYSVGLIKNVGIPEPQNPKALGCEPASPPSILRFDSRVLTAIDFNDQSNSVAHEVNDVGANWNLTAKTKSAHLLAPKSKPEAQFRIGHPVAQPSCPFDVSSGRRMPWQCCDHG